MENDVETRCTSGQSLVILNQLGDTKTWPFEMVSELNLGTTETLKIFGPERPIKLSSKGVKTTHLENALSYSLVHEHQITHSFQKNRYWKKYIFFLKFAFDSKYARKKIFLIICLCNFQNMSRRHEIDIEKLRGFSRESCREFVRFKIVETSSFKNAFIHSLFFVNFQLDKQIKFIVKN